MAMNQLGNGLYGATRFAEALSVHEAELSMFRRLGASEASMLVLQGNLSSTYEKLGRSEEALSMRRDVYSGWLRLKGEEHKETLRAANNYAVSLLDLRRFAEARSLMRRMTPVARRVLGEGQDLTLRSRWIYAQTLYKDDGATLGDIREAVTTLEDTGRTARRVFGVTHPTATGIAYDLQKERAALAAREGDGVNSVREAMEAMAPGDA